MFESTLPIDDAELMHVSEFRRRHLDPGRGDDTSTSLSRLTSLSATLMDDLRRFEPVGNGGDGLEALEVLAAAMRHGRALLLHMQHSYRVIPLTVFPPDGQLHCTLLLEQLLSLELSELRVLHIEPAWLRPIGSHETQRLGDSRLYAPLGAFLWELSLRGQRGTLLPEIAGAAAYRIAPGSALHPLGLTGTLGEAVARLRRAPSNLREIASWPGFDRERAMRMLNGLYLQAALIVSRSHPAATDEHHLSWPV